MSAIAVREPAEARPSLLTRWPFRFAKMTVFYGVLGSVGLVFVAPYIFTFIGSLKPDSGIFGTSPWTLPSHPVWANYSDTWGNYSQVETHFSTFFFNTLIVTICLTVGQVFFSMLAAY